MVAIPTLAQEDAKRPNRERESLVGEQSRIVNRMKAALARLGIRGFNPKLKKAVERLDGLRTPEGEPIPPNTLARSGNARVPARHDPTLMAVSDFQKDSALAHWFYARTKNAPQTRKTMIVALARKLLIALWRLAREGAIPEGIVLRPAL